MLREMFSTSWRMQAYAGWNRRGRALSPQSASTATVGDVPESPEPAARYFAEDDHPQMEKYVVKPIFSVKAQTCRSLRTAKPLKQRKSVWRRRDDCSAIPPVTEIRRSYMLIGSWLVNDQPAGIGILKTVH